jgi:arylsulfatase A-like enzyme
VRRPTRSRTRALPAALLATLAACGPGTRPAQETLVEVAGWPAPIIFVMIDTLRADHTSLLGYERDTTPFLSELAESSIVFERAHAAAAWTRPSVASVFTSRLPEAHGCEDRKGVLSESLTLLPEVLQSAGYETRGVITNGMIADTWGFDQGWDSYRFVKRRPMREYTDAGLLELFVTQALDALAPPPFFLYLHYVDPHEPYLLHPEHEWDPDYDGTFNGEVATLEPFRHRTPSPANRQRVVDLYDGEVAYMDRHLRRLFDELQTRGLLDQSWIVITSDHGEGLWDHGEMGHAGQVQQEVLHVPLLIRPPGGLETPMRVSEPISLIDVAPTLVQFVGLNVPAEWDGRSWAPYLGGGPRSPARPVVSDEEVDGKRLATVVDGRWKLVVDLDSGDRALYDLVRNPDELEELAIDPVDTPHAEAERLEQELSAALSAAARRRPADAIELREELRELPPDVAAQMEALGYVGGGR